MSRFLIAASIVALCTTPAFVGDVMANTYGNTVISTGRALEVHTHYRADHSFDMDGSMMDMSETFKGTWALDSKGYLRRTFAGGTPPNTANRFARRSQPTHSARPGRWTPTASPHYHPRARHPIGRSVAAASFARFSC
jgi:hypothetical protein